MSIDVRAVLQHLEVAHAHAGAAYYKLRKQDALDTEMGKAVQRIVTELVRLLENSE